MDRLRLLIGQTDFRTIRESGCYYVDKTCYISQLIRDSASSILFTRPRRFGKTTFQTMLRAFFDIREDSYDIFDGLEIMNDSEAVEKWMNRCPVIYLTFKDIDGLDFDSAMAILHYKVAELIASYRAVADTAMSGNEKEILHRILDGECSNDDVRLSISALAKLLYNHYGKKVIFILDE